MHVAWTIVDKNDWDIETLIKEIQMTLEKIIDDIFTYGEEVNIDYGVWIKAWGANGIMLFTTDNILDDRYADKENIKREIYSYLNSYATALYAKAKQFTEMATEIRVTADDYS